MSGTTVAAESCDFTDYQHVMFQVANGILLISYVSPHGIYGDLFLRICLTIGLLLLTLWAAIVICGLDVLLWNGVFTAINAFHALWILWRLRPWITFPPDVHSVYRDLFMPMKVSKESFSKIYKCVRNFDTLKPNDTYCQEGVTKVDKLSLVLDGKVAVLRKEKVVHLIEPHQFIDSPEWFGVGHSDTYQVTVKALEPTKIMTWHRDKLKLCIADNDYLKAVLDNVLGKDVVKKLLYSLEHPVREWGVREWEAKEFDAKEWGAKEFDAKERNVSKTSDATNGPTNEATKLLISTQPQPNKIHVKSNGDVIQFYNPKPVSSFWSLIYGDDGVGDGDSNLFFDYETNV